MSFIIGLLLLGEKIMANPVPSIEEIFNGLNKDTMHMIDDFYAPQAEFMDPVTYRKTPAEIKKYYENLYANVESIRFDFSKHVVQGDDHVVFWTMHLTHKRLNNGKPVSLIGNSHIVLDPKTKQAIYHRDYFDMGEFIYEKIPVLGMVIRKIKSFMN